MEVEFDSLPGYHFPVMAEKRFFIETFGCQMNMHDSQKLDGILVSRGWQRAHSPEDADVIILNTCSVREKAEQKVLSRVGRLGRLKKHANRRIVLAGCMAQAWGEALLKKSRYVDFVVGPGELKRIPEILETPSGKSAAVHVETPASVFSVNPAWLPLQGSCTAWLTVMEGCNNFCSYCVVPYVRGRERSRPPEDIVAEAEHLVRRGIREITLLGQNVNSYDGCKGGFPELLERVSAVEGLLRVRFTTSHPKDMSSRLIRCVAELPNVCEYLHFPAQSGSTRILDAMRRGYTREQYLEKVQEIREAIPGAALSSDFIVGFPGETHQDFLDTLSLIEAVRFDNIFAFKYSVRPHTRASRLPDDVPENEKLDRLQEIIALQRDISYRKNAALIGETVEVLVEGAAKRGAGKMMGRTRRNRIVNFTGSAEKGVLQRVRIDSVSVNCLYGELVGKSG